MSYQKNQNVYVIEKVWELLNIILSVVMNKVFFVYNENISVKKFIFFVSSMNEIDLVWLFMKRIWWIILN